MSQVTPKGRPVKDQGETVRSRSISLLDKWNLLQAILGDPNLSPGAKVVAAALLGFLNSKTGQCNPGFGRLLKASGYSQRATVAYNIAALERAGWVSIERRFGARNSYSFAFDRTVETSAVYNTGPEPETSAVQNTGSGQTDMFNGHETSAVDRTGTSAVDRTLTREVTREEKRECGVAAPVALKNAEDRFEEFWRHYPKQSGEKEARAEFIKAVKAGTDAATIIAGAMRYAAKCIDKDDRWIKEAANWLRDERWNDPPRKETATAQPERQQPARYNGGGGCLAAVAERQRRRQEMAS